MNHQNLSHLPDASFLRLYAYLFGACDETVAVLRARFQQARLDSPNIQQKISHLLFIDVDYVKKHNQKPPKTIAKEWEGYPVQLLSWKVTTGTECIGNFCQNPTKFGCRFNINGEQVTICHRCFNRANEFMKHKNGDNDIHCDIFYTITSKENGQSFQNYMNSARRVGLNDFNLAAASLTQPPTSAPASAAPPTASTQTLPTTTASTKRRAICPNESEKNTSCEDSSSTSSEDSEDARKRKKQRTSKKKQCNWNEVVRLCSSIETNHLNTLESLSNLCSGVVAKLNKAHQLASNLHEYVQPGEKRVTCFLLCPCCNEWRRVGDWVRQSWSPFRLLNGHKELRQHNPNLYHGMIDNISPEILVLNEIEVELRDDPSLSQDHDFYQYYARQLLLCSGFKIFLNLYLKPVDDESDIDQAAKMLFGTTPTDDSYESNGMAHWLNLLVNLCLRRKDNRRERFSLVDISTAFNDVRSCVGSKFEKLVSGDTKRIDIKKLIWDKTTLASFGYKWNNECAKGFEALYKKLFDEMESLDRTCETMLENELKNLFHNTLTVEAIFKVMRNASENQDAFNVYEWEDEIKDLKRYQKKFAGRIANTISLHCKTLKIIEEGAEHS